MSVATFARNTFFFAAFALITAAPAKAVTIWDESVNGDLSDLPASPTNVGSLSIGDNSIFGALVDEHDYFTFEVLAGETLDSFTVVSQTLTGDAAPNLFFLTSSSPIAGDLVGALNWFSSNVKAGDDLFKKPGFFHAPNSAPLGAGFYSVVFAGFGHQVNAYNFDLHVSGPSTDVPEPTTAGMVIAGIIGLVSASIGRSKRAPTI